MDSKKIIRETIQDITPADPQTMQEAVRRQDSLAKPPGSLGGLEEISVRMAGITGEVIPAKGFPGRGCVIVFCADNGVVNQGSCLCASERDPGADH